MTDSSSSSPSQGFSHQMTDQSTNNNNEASVRSPAITVANMPDTTTPAAVTPVTSNPTSTTTTENTKAANNTVREDLVKSAVSFLTSTNVRSADKAKKIAFLQKKGLIQIEIDEAFKRAGDAAAPTNIPTTTTTQPYNDRSSVQQQQLAPILPTRNYGHQPQPQVIYYPQPPAPPVPAEKVFALAMIVGMGAVGLTAGAVGILRHFINPILNRIAEYQRTRYNQRQEIAERLLKSIKSFETENEDLDAVIDQGEEKSTTEALVVHEQALLDKIENLVQTSRERISSVLRQKTYSDFRSDINNFKSIIVTTNGGDYSSYNGYSSRYGGSIGGDSPAVSGLKSDIRSVKAALLNRRNFPTA